MVLAMTATVLGSQSASHSRIAWSYAPSWTPAARQVSSSSR
jgi:hypothetical protein